MNKAPLAFYAPLKPPGHPNPSGDRQLARLLMQALSLADFEVELASRFRSRDGAGDPLRQARLERVGARLAARLIRRYRRLPQTQRPRLWLTYHLYHKAPDWLGPAVSRALKIPYVVAEASYAPKQAAGPWQLGLQASLEALNQARAVLCLNPVDRDCLAERLPSERLHPLPPFLDLRDYFLRDDVLRDDATDFPSRAALAPREGLDPDQPWLICVAMMRPGDKAHSYRLLADALTRLPATPWQLLVIGDGQEAAQIKGYFATLQDRVRFLGARGPDQLRPLLAAADLCVWPAVNEAFGLALLEAQALGTPVLAGNEGGVASILAPGCRALLTPPRDPARFAATLANLLADPSALITLGREARDHVHRHHGLVVTADRLRTLLRPLLESTP